MTKRQTRNAAIDECARVVDSWLDDVLPIRLDEIARAIRALKSKDCD